MNLLKDIDAVIFDLDGTLIDSMLIWREIDEDFLGSRNITMPENLQKSIEGKSFYETAVYFKETFDLPESVEEIMAIWNKMAFDKYCNGMNLKPGAKELLCGLKANNIKLGIATSNSRPLAEGCLLNLGIFECFSVVVTGNEVINGKPDPEVYLTAATKLSVEPARCLVFEDITMGIMAGNNAGMTTCAVYDVYSEHMDAEKKKLADYYIDSFEDIINQNWNL